MERGAEDEVQGGIVEIPSVASATVFPALLVYGRPNVISGVGVLLEEELLERLTDLHEIRRVMFEGKVILVGFSVSPHEDACGVTLTDNRGMDAGSFWYFDLPERKGLVRFAPEIGLVLMTEEEAGRVRDFLENYTLVS